MKKYAYVYLDITRLVGAGTDEHRRIIDTYAAKGYRYVGFIPLDINNQGKIKSIDLIFETEE